MISRFVARCLTIVFLGLAAGVAHSWINARSDRPLIVESRLSDRSALEHLLQPPASSPDPSGQTPAAVQEPTPQPAPSNEPAAAGTPPAPTPEEPAPPPPAPPTADDKHDEGMLTLAEAKQLFDRGQAEGIFFIDARHAGEYAAGHIAGAMHLPPEAFGGPPPAKAVDYLSGQIVIVYCGGGLCDASKNVAKYLQQLGIPAAVYVFEDGYPAWADAGYPTETGPDPLGN